MQAKPGDRVVIEGPKVGGARRCGEIVEVVHGRAGDHFRVRWEHDEHESILYPAPGTFIEPDEAETSHEPDQADATKSPERPATSPAPANPTSTDEPPRAKGDT